MYYAALLTEGTITAFQRNQMSGDFDGDGRTDFVQLVGTRSDPSVYPPGSWMGRRATDTGFVGFGLPSTGKVKLDVEASPGARRFVDFNADAPVPLGDVVTGFGAAAGDVDKVEVCRNDGTQLLSCINLPGVSAATSGVQHIGDADGDGRLDVYLPTGVCQLSVTSLGAGNADQYAYACSPWAGSNVFGHWGDFNGDGRIDRAAYVETSPTTGYWNVNLAGHGGFPDLLASVTNGVGHVTQFEYRGLHDPGVYTRGSVLAYPKVNVNSGAPVVSTMRVANGLGGWISTVYKYEGHRIDASGRGALGFEVVRTFTPVDGINRIVTTVTASQTFPTIGLPLDVESKHEQLGIVLSRTVNTWSTYSTAGGATATYLSSSQVSGNDLDGSSKPTTTTAIPAPPTGIDPSYGNVLVTTQTTTTPPVDGVSEQFVTTTTNDYYNQPSNWLIGLLKTRTTTKSATQAGTTTSAPTLTLSACTSTTPTLSPTAATMSCTLGNTGQTVASSIAYTSPAGTVVTGPTNCSAGAANCGTVTVTTGTSAGTYAGTLVATPTPAGLGASAAVSLTVNPRQPALTLTGCSSVTPTTSPTAASMTCTLGNSGPGAATSVTYAAPPSTTPSGPSSCAASTTNCGPVTVTTSTVPGSYSGTLTATPTPAGTAASASVALTVSATPPALTLTACSSTSPTTSPTAATMTCTLGNTGQTAATSIAYSSPSGTTRSGPASCEPHRVSRRPVGLSQTLLV